MLYDDFTKGKKRKTEEGTRRSHGFLSAVGKKPSGWMSWRIKEGKGTAAARWIFGDHLRKKKAKSDPGPPTKEKTAW